MFILKFIKLIISGIFWTSYSEGDPGAVEYVSRHPWLSGAVIFGIIFLVVLVVVGLFSLMGDLDFSSGAAGVAVPPGYIPTKEDTARHIRGMTEHIHMREYFFSDPQTVFEELKKDGKRWIESEYASYMETLGRDIRYMQEVFGTSELTEKVPELSETGTEILCFALPEASGLSECAAAYFVLTGGGEGHYFVMERSAWNTEEDAFVLYGWDRNGKKKSYGMVRTMLKRA